jgi:hypothetical protein
MEYGLWSAGVALSERARRTLGSSVYLGYGGSDVQFLNRVVKALGEVDPKIRIYNLLLERRLSPGIPGITRKTLLALSKLTERTLDRTLSWLADHQLIDKIRGRAETYYFAI